jgi:hypothetical protein
MEFDSDAQLGDGGLVAVYFRVPHDTLARDVAGIGGQEKGGNGSHPPTTSHCPTPPRRSNSIMGKVNINILPYQSGICTLIASRRPHRYHFHIAIHI